MPWPFAIPGLTACRALADHLRVLPRRAAFLLALFLGALAALGLPPLFFILVLPISFSALLWLCDGARTVRRAFFLGWWFGFGYFLAGLYWIAHALLTDPARYGFLIPIAVPGMAGGLAVFCGLSVAGFKYFSHAFPDLGKGAARLFLWAVFWTVGEWLRGHVLTGFPWNLVGSSWAFHPVFLQMAAFTGVWGMSLFTFFLASVPALLGDDAKTTPRPVVWQVAGLGIVACIGLSGFARLQQAGLVATMPMVPGVQLRIVQPNVEQNHKWKESLREAQFAEHLSLTRAASSQAGPAAPTHVIWPETAAPFFLSRETDILSRIAAVVPPQGLVITGAPRVSESSAEKPQIWNSIEAIDAQGAIVGIYDKFHLVPFGEYLPLRFLLPAGVSKLTHGSIDFSAGPGPVTMKLPGLPALSPLICYEIIFPGHVLDQAERPHWLLNLTNDAWFGLSSGPHQHFTAARLRAAEEGLPVVRAANTGISGVIDAYGRVVASLGLGERGVLDSPLPRPLPFLTPYARWGDWILFLLLAGFLSACIGMALVEKKKQ